MMPQKNLFFKICLLSVLMFTMMLALLFVRYLVNEREGYQYKVIEEIKQNQISSQTIISPFIRVPYTTQSLCDEKEYPHLAGKVCTIEQQQLLFPSQSEWNATFKVQNDQYHRGIYRVINYTSHLNGKGAFSTQTMSNQRVYQWEKATFVVPIKDLRGVQQKAVLNLNGVKYSLDFAKDKQQNGQLDALELAIPITNYPTVFNFELNLQVEGLQRFTFIPTNENSKFSAQGNWADIKYFGSLPQKNTSMSQEFTASWQNMRLGEQYQQGLTSCINKDNCDTYFISEHRGETNSGFNIDFIEPINIYSQTDRATKYGWLITLITFSCFFLFEILKGLRIHPIQYLLVGVAQSIFFVLLISISEHFSYLIAYSFASIACIGLISWYLIYVLKSGMNALVFSGLLSSLYAVMYMLLQSSEKTFLLGSILAFLFIAMVMYMTRHIDWYAIGEQPKR